VDASKRRRFRLRSRRAELYADGMKKTVVIGATQKVLIDDGECLLVRVCPSCHAGPSQLGCSCAAGFLIEPFPTLAELKASAK